ncbi:MAG TPA: malonyl-CoA decarboxylase [Alphaproteobacteria bacterium]|nr:malonyl-CoA decarboxylase [Alphaproteobacteria bacterium]
MNQIPLQLKSFLSSAVKRLGLPQSLPLALPAPENRADELIRLCDVLLARRGEAWAATTASEVLAGYRAASRDERNRFLAILAQSYNADASRLDKAIAAYQAQRSAASMAEIHAASESRRQHLIHELNLAPGGTLMLLRMREDGLRNRQAIPDFEALDADFREVLGSWFNRGFLTLKRIDWSSPAAVLRKIIEYEAVHEIKDWDDLRRRVEPPDRRCYAFFHPQIPEEPLIFVEVALTGGIPSSVQALLDDKRAPLSTSTANTAVFYSISNCQEGLRGVPFGSFLIKQVAELLKSELPGVKTFVTLSPIPTFATWLERERKMETSDLILDSERPALAALSREDWQGNEDARAALTAIAARFFLNVRSKDKRPYDSVARFHLGNGAELANIHWMADISSKGLKQSHGLMVNYLYDLKHIERNQTALESRGEIAVSGIVQKLARSGMAPHERLLGFLLHPTEPQPEV